MDEIVWVVNPRNDTLENLATYLSHYAVEYFQNTSHRMRTAAAAGNPALSAVVGNAAQSVSGV